MMQDLENPASGVPAPIGGMGMIAGKRKGNKSNGLNGTATHLSVAKYDNCTQGLEWLPDGYVLNSSGHLSRLIYSKKDGEQLLVLYPGIIRVVGAEVNLDTQQSTVTSVRDNSLGSLHYRIEFPLHGGKLQSVLIPASEVAIGNSCVKALASRGASVYDSIAKEMAEYLVKSFERVRNELHYKKFTQRLGHVEGCLVTPARIIGDHVESRGTKYTVGNDHGAYKESIIEVIKWGEAAWFTFFCLGMSLASPLFGRIKEYQPQRNPVVTIIGQSGSGKTTVAKFAEGVWGTPGLAPFHVDAGNKITATGLNQLAQVLGGLPYCLDEIHHAKPDLLQMAFYSHANGQDRVIGSLNGFKGGNPTSGVLFCAGEGLPSLPNAGAFNRAIIVDVAEHPPLGVVGLDNQGRVNKIGKERARILERAWGRGCGLLGPAVYEYILANWNEFLNSLAVIHKQENLNNIDPWGEVMVIVMAVLQFMCAHLDLPVPTYLFRLPEFIETIISNHRSGEHNPDIDAFENLCSMLASATEAEERQPDGSVIGKGYYALNGGRGEIVWWPVERRDGVKCMAVPTHTEAFKRVVAGGVSRHGEAWLSKKLIVPQGKNLDKYSQPLQSNPSKISVRCLLIPIITSPLG